MRTLLLVGIPLAPLLAAALVAAAGRRWGVWTPWLPVAGAAASLGGAAALYRNSFSVETIWFELGGTPLTVGLHIDALAWHMTVLVTGIALCIHVYAVGYMRDEPGQARFFAWMSFFTGAMLALVLAGSFVLLFAAWEAVGLASWALIGFRHREEPPRRAATLAFLITRAADFGFLAAWLWIFVALGTTSIESALGAVTAGDLDDTALTTIALLLLLAAAGKSAQLPLAAWLPEAMAGPAPVSALIHSATMVSAGVYLILRLFPLFEAAPGTLSIVLWVGLLTAVFAAFVAATESEAKRVLAWSTVSHLGNMMLALGLAAPAAALFHLTVHAVFKSQLFLVMGAVEHRTQTTDLDRLGGLRRRMPLVAAAFGAGGLALAAVPPFAGFWSDEEILKSAVESGAAMALVVVAMVLLAGIYIGRLGAAVFWDWGTSPMHPAASEQTRAGTGKKADSRMTGAVLFLAALSVGSGYFLRPETPDSLPWAWRLVAIAAGLAGLGLGTMRVVYRGPAPWWGGVPARLAVGLRAATDAPAAVALSGAGTIRQVETGLERGGNFAARGASCAAGRVARTEALLSTLDRAISTATLKTASGVDRVEAGAVSEGVDAAAGGLGRLGAHLRRTQTGEVYHYTMGVALWVIAAGLLLTALWL